MSSITATDSLLALAQDIALGAWNDVRQDGSEPTSFEVVKDSGFPQKTSIYRLGNAGPGGTDVIAKRSRLTKVLIEKVVYEQMLPAVAVHGLRYFGTIEEKGSRFGWLFIEDAQGERFDRKNRALVDEWLAGLHTGAAHLPRPPELPSTGPAHYFEVLQLARKGVARALVELPDEFDDESDQDDEKSLTRALVLLDQLERRWHEVEELCAGLPDTLQHGDFARKNLVMTPSGDLVPLDWEAAAWGPAAIDLTFVDPERYVAQVAGSWPALTVEAVEQGDVAGRIFWHLSAMRWATRDYPAERSKRKLEDNFRKLTETLATAGLT